MDTDEVDNQASIGTAACRAAKEGDAIREPADARKRLGTGDEKVTGVGEGVSETEYCIIARRKGVGNVEAWEEEQGEDQELHGSGRSDGRDKGLIDVDGGNEVAFIAASPASFYLHTRSQSLLVGWAATTI